MKLLKYIKKYRGPAIIGFICKIIEAILELMTPLIMVNIIDKGVKNKDINYIIIQGIFLIMIGVIAYLFALVCQYYASKTSQSVGTELKRDMYDVINDYDYAQLDKLPPSTLVNRITNDVVQIQLAIAMTIRLTSRAPVLIIGSLVMAFFVSPKLSIIFIIGAILLSIIIAAITILSIPYFNYIQKKLDKISLILRENLMGIRVVRAFFKQDKEINRYTKETKEQKDTQIKVGKIQALLNPLTYLVVNLAIVLIIYSGGLQVNLGSLTQGQVVALINYMNQILLAVIVFGNVLTIYNKAVSSSKRIVEVLETKSSIKNEGTQNNWDYHHNCITFNNVCFSYEEHHVLSDINFSLNKGETLGIIGGIGSGKTTLSNLIMRFYEVDSGDILIDNKLIKDIELEYLRNNISIVPQKASLISGTVRDNLKLGNNEASDEEIKNALKIAQAYDFVMELEDGLDTLIEQGSKNLSGGQIQRLTIARAIVKKPKILILDDSSSALDFVTEKALSKAIKKIKDITTIIISQRTSSIQHADRILVLEHGNLVGNNHHTALLDECELYQEIHYSQQIKEDK